MSGINTVPPRSFPNPPAKNNPSIVLYLYDPDYHILCFIYSLNYKPLEGRDIEFILHFIKHSRPLAEAHSSCLYIFWHDWHWVEVLKIITETIASATLIASSCLTLYLQIVTKLPFEVGNCVHAQQSWHRQTESLGRLPSSEVLRVPSPAE